MKLEQRIRAGILTAGCCVAYALTAAPAAAATPAGTAITNTSTATYSDGSTNYSSQSNTVTTTVQNVAALTVVPSQGTPGTNALSAGGTVTDTYTLSNVGNSGGYFALSGAQSTNDGVSSGSAAFVNYVVNVLGQPAQTFTTVAAVNTYLATGNAGGPFLTPNAVGAPDSSNQITIGVTFTANAGATGTVVTLLSPTVTQPAGTGTTVATSAAVVGQYSDTISADARMDVQIAVVSPTGSTPATYTVRYNNGGGRPMVAVNRAGLPAGSGITGAGIVVTDKLPQYPSGTPLGLNGTPVFVVQPAGATLIYSIDGTTWTTSLTGAAYVGVFIPASALTGSFGASNPGSAQNTVSAAQAQMTFSFALNSSAASGAANATAVTDVANSIFGDSSSFIEGPGIAYQSVVNSGSATAAQTAPAVANADGNQGGSALATSSAAAGATLVLNGPSGQAGASGPDATTATDYTVISYTNGGTLSSAVTGSTASVPASATPITFTNSLQNAGNRDDTFALTSTIATLPSGWTTQFQTAGGAPITSIAVPSGTTVTYKLVLTPPASITTFSTFTLYDDPVVATSANDNTKNNVTHDDFLVGGFVRLTKTAAVAAAQPCATATTFTPGAVTGRPGDCVQYTLTYLNVSPAGGTGNVSLGAVTVVIAEDGTVTGGSGATAFANNWAANTNGLFAVPVDSTGGTLGGYSGAGASGSTRFTDSIAALAAGASGTVVFLVQVK